MGRLTKYGKTSHENGVCCTHFNSKECKEVLGNCAFGCKWEEEAWSKLAEYESLEEQGLLIRLPCKVGDEVYWVTDLGVVKRYVSSMDLIRTNHVAIKLQPLGLDGEFYPFSIIKFSDDFGKTVFLTKEEAEKKLKRRKNG